MLLMCAACELLSGGKDTETPEINLSSEQKVALNPEGDDTMVTFYSAMAWTIELSSVNEANWLRVNKTSGGTGDFSINVVADANHSGKKRTVSMDIISEGITKSVVFTQESTELQGKDVVKSIGAEGGVIEWNIKYSGSYDIDIDVDWISHAETKALNSAILVFEIEANGGEARTGKVTLSGSGKEFVLKVDQDAYVEEEVFKLLSDSATVSAEGGKVEVTLETNIDYEYEIQDDWVKEVSSKAVEEKVHEFEVEPNPTDEERSTVVTFCANETCIPFIIKQEAGESKPEPYLSVDVEDLYIDADDLQPKVVNVTSNVEWTVRTDKSWCRISTKTGQNDGSFEITCTENTGSERTAVVKVYSGDLSCLIDVTQKAYVAPEEGYLTLSKEELSFSASAGTQSLTVKSNESWTVSSSSEWCSVTPDSGSGDGSVSVVVSENDSEVERKAEITFRSESCEVVAYVIQSGKEVEPILEINTKGITCFVNTAIEQDVIVTSNVAWKVSSNVSWCTASPSSGEGDGTFTLSIKENNTKKLREAVIRVYSDTIERSFSVVQPGSSGTEGFEDDDHLDWDN